MSEVAVEKFSTLLLEMAIKVARPATQQLIMREDFMWGKILCDTIVLNTYKTIFWDENVSAHYILSKRKNPWLFLSLCYKSFLNFKLQVAVCLLEL